MDATAAVLERILVWGLLPVWAVAGLGDWCCHRVMRIERSVGPWEPAFHLAMLGELGFGVLVTACCEVTAGVLALLLGICILHEVTMLGDLVFAERRRRIPPIEQWVHAVQQSMPWAAFAILAIVYRDHLLAVMRDGVAGTDWRFYLRAEPLPATVWLFIVAAGACLCVAFFTEWLRSRRAWQRRLGR